MEIHCPHCSQPLLIEDAELRTLTADTEIPCPGCGGAVIVKAGELGPGVKVHRQLNRNVLILGAAALLALGGIVFVIASRLGGNDSHVDQKIVNKLIENEFFRNLIAEGKTTEEALAEVEEAVGYGEGYVGISREELSIRDAMALAERTGAKILDPADSGQDSPLQVADWLSKTFPERKGRATWIRPLFGIHDKRVIDGPDILSCSNLTSLKARVFLTWEPHGKPWKNLGWSWSIEPTYDQVREFDQWGLARVRQGNKWGLIDRDGAVVLPIGYAEVGPFSRYGSARIRSASGIGLIDEKGRVVAKPEWDDVQDFIHGFVPVKRDEKWGYLDSSGKQIFPCEWDDAWRFGPAGTAVVTKNGKRGLINREGKLVLQPVWDGITNIAREGIGMVRRGESWGLIDAQGKALTSVNLQLDFGEANSWEERCFDWGYLGVKSNSGKFTVLKLDGGKASGMEGVIGIKAISGGGLYHLLLTFSDGSQSLKGRDGEEIYHSSPDEPKVGDISGKRRYPARPADEFLRNGLFYVEDRSGTSGLLNASGEWVMPLSKYKKRVMSDGLILVEQAGKMGLTKMDGTILTKMEWDEIRDYVEGFAAVRQGDKWGFIDRDGKVVIAPIWAEVGSFGQGVVAVSTKKFVVRDRRRVNAPTGGYPCSFVDVDGKKVFDLVIFSNVNSWQRLPRFSAGKTVYGAARDGDRPVYWNSKGEVVSNSVD
ncbi:WG repeat-containing protein, partial [Haloferula sp.]|uniref:WG repeat-containing protein n=1 Tax=Haloferula sp. TaxID=2497595 RepID=UPI003C7760C0